MNRQLLSLAMMLAAALPVAGEPQAVLDLGIVPPKGKALLWSPLFQASWDKLNAMHTGKVEKIVPPNELMDRLDHFEWNEPEVMPTGGGYAVFAGPATAEFAHATSLAMKKQFGVEMAPDQLPGTPGGNAVYGILMRDLEFKREFFRSRSNPLNFTDGLGKRHDVKFFGTMGELSDHYGTSVRVHEYAEAGKRFILSIATDKADERLVIYRPEKGGNFKSAVDHVVAAIKAPLAGTYGSVTDGNLHKNDMVKIPYISLEANTQLTAELGGLRHYRGDPQPWRIEMAYQIVDFELFEKGARVRVETAVEEGPFGELEAPPKPVRYAPRRFVCDVPFFVFTWREKGPLPYFAAWIDGIEVLKPMPPTVP